MNSAEDQIRVRAARLRVHCLRSTSEAGSGHPTSCLSAADLVAALFFHVMRYHPESPGHPDNDRFVLSKGHAAPLLYAAWAEAGAFDPEKLLTLRRFDSELEGHPTPRFPGAIAATGSLGQGLSIGVGLALAAKRDGRPFRVYVLLGDGETAEGSVWEAVALGAYYGLDNLVAIVDVNGFGQSQRTMYGFDVDSYCARLRSFGWEAVGIDGHDPAQILGAFDLARRADRPFAIVAETRKGKGVSFLEDKEGWHGKALKKGEELERALRELEPEARREVPPVSPRRPEPWSPPPPSGDRPIPPPEYRTDDSVATREAYGSALVKLGAVRPEIVVLDADTKNSTFSERFLAAYPDRFFEEFIAEQNMVGTAVGLAACGKVPFLSTFACFLTRAFDHLRMAAISRANLKCAGSHCGVSIGEDGPSQMGLEDLAMMRALPGSTVFYPCDAVSTEKLVVLAASLPGISYLRLTRPKTPILYSASEEFSAGGSKVLRSGDGRDSLAVVTAGITVFEALRAFEILRDRGLSVRVIDAYSVKPIDAATLVRSGKECGGKILTVEDHYPEGGLGEAVLEAVGREGIRVHKLAVREIPRSGKPAELLHAYGIDHQAIVAAAERLARES
ncbi:MAG: transketolase [Candidatus Binatia bacterium]|nr:MAG: transketolase [Candidatus Binatia bacterium]